MKKVSEKRGLTTEESRMLVNDVLDAMWESILEDKILTISGFGTYNLYIRKSRSARNPSSQEKVEVPETLQVTFDLGLPKRDALYDRKTKKPTPLGKKVMDDIRIVLDEDESNKGDASSAPRKLQKKQIALMQERIQKEPLKKKWLKDSSQSVVPPVKKGKVYGEQSERKTHSDEVSDED